MKQTVILFIAVAVVLLLAYPVAAAEQVPAYGGVLKNYTNQSGNSEIQVRVNIPLTVEDVAYPDWLFGTLFAAGFLCLLIGIFFVARSESVPILAIIACGILALGCFASCAVMAPYVATIHTNTDIVVNQSGSTAVYTEQTVNYLFSFWVGWLCWGGALAGFVMAILGTMSLFGWLPQRGIGDAQNGEYLETDGISTPEQQYRIDGGNNSYKKIGNGKAKR